MKILYLECNMGAAGDMLLAALSELLPDRAAFIDCMNALPLPGLRFSLEPAEKCGIHGTRARITFHGHEEEPAPDGPSCSAVYPAHPHEDMHEHEHVHPHPHEDLHEHEHVHSQPHEDLHEHEHVHSHPHKDLHEHEHVHSHGGMHEHHSHSSLHEICALIDSMPLPDQVKRDAKAVYERIGQAESHAHGVPVANIHFHEVGTLDAVADVAGCSLALHLLAPDAIIASPVCTGSGTVRCAHGVLPVPAPATAFLLKDIPIYAGDVRTELCTPTGAALLAHFCNAFGPMPMIRVQNVGYGMGHKDFPTANCVRAFMGESGGSQEEILELCCNLDDMTPEAVSYAGSLLLDSGALDVYTQAIGMKKSRSALLLTVLCRPEKEEALSRLMLTHTTTLGVRRRGCVRRTLQTHVENVSTAYGNIRIKIGQGYGVTKWKPEYDDLAAAAQEHAIPLQTVEAAARAAFIHQAEEPTSH